MCEREKEALLGFRRVGGGITADDFRW